MIGRRKSPDGLPFNLYKYSGKRFVSFGYKNSDNKWLFRLRAPKANIEKVAEVRAEAIRRAEALNGNSVESGTIADLIARYFSWQDELGRNDERRKADVTLKENKREANFLAEYFGKMAPLNVRPMHIYEYLDIRAKGGAPAKANKEIALLSAALEFGRRKGEIEINPCSDIKYNPVRPSTATVPRAHMAIMLRVARQRRGQYLVQALCAKAAYHAVGRPEEMRYLLRSGIKSDGVQIPVGKRKPGYEQRHKLAEWNSALRTAIKKALSLRPIASIYVFANASGGAYNRYSWANGWKRLMDHCERYAEARAVPFVRFTLATMRPTSVTQRMDGGDERITDATGHTDPRTARKIYDRRKVRRFKATD